MRKTFVEVNVDQVLKQAQRLGQLDASTLQKATTVALNTAVDQVYDLTRSRMNADINLDDDYLRRRMELEYATGSKLEATISAGGGRSAQTRLMSYNAGMVPAFRITDTPSRSKGYIRLPAGFKQGGVAVQVRRSKVAFLPNAFLLPLRAGAALSDKYGVFTRTGDKLRHRYGPAVYQLFGYQAPRVTDEAGEILEREVLAETLAELEKAL